MPSGQSHEKRTSHNKNEQTILEKYHSSFVEKSKPGTKNDEDKIIKNLILSMKRHSAKQTSHIRTEEALPEKT